MLTDPRVCRHAISDVVVPFFPDDDVVHRPTYEHAAGKMSRGPTSFDNRCAADCAAAAAAAAVDTVVVVLSASEAPRPSVCDDVNKTDRTS